MRIEVQVAGRTGSERSPGWVEVEELSLGRRAILAGRTALIGLVIGLLFLPVPLIHLFGVFAFLVSLGLAVRRFGTRTALRQAGGACPGCGQDGRFFVGLGSSRFRLPTTTSCSHCAMALTLLPC
jgi:hypothetical protein